MSNEPLHHTLIKHYEALALKAYLCPAGVPTIGYGHTGPDVTMTDVKFGKTITTDEADALFNTDIKKFESGCQASTKGRLTLTQLGAVVSLTFNIGQSRFDSSTLLSLIFNGSIDNCGAEFLKWNKGRVKGVLVVLDGLTKRRKSESILFTTGTLVFPS